MYVNVAYLLTHHILIWVLHRMELLLVLAVISGVAKAGPGRARARPKFVQYMCARALVLNC